MIAIGFAIEERKSLRDWDIDIDINKSKIAMEPCPRSHDLMSLRCREYFVCLSVCAMISFGLSFDEIEIGKDHSRSCLSLNMKNNFFEKINIWNGEVIFESHKISLFSSNFGLNHPQNIKTNFHDPQMFALWTVLFT